MILPLTFAFLFSGPVLALMTAAGAASVPVLIHLFSRRRYRIVSWAAMRFLLAAQKQNVRRLRLEQYLLLAVRMLMLLLVVLAMASVMPWAESLWQRLFPEGMAIAAPGSLRTYKVLVLDGSLSMAAHADEQNAFERARARARDILGDAPRGDGFSVVLMAAPPQSIVVEAADDPRRVGDEIGRLRLPHGNADLAGTLAMVEDMMKRAPGKFEAREVYFLTDMQRSTWVGGPTKGVAEAMQRIQELGKVIFVDVGKDIPVNVAVTDLTLATPLATTGADTPITATLRCFGNEERKQVRVELLVGRARAEAKDPPCKPTVVAQQLVAVPSGKVGVAVTFLHRFTVPGDYAVQVRVESDGLEPDDARTLILTVKDGVPVLVVDGKPGAGPLGGAADFLAPALNPYAQEKEIPRNLVARPRVVSLAEFNHPDTGDLTPYDCVFLCDVGLLGPAQVQRLEAHLRQGGGVVCCLGPQVNLDVYNRFAYRDGEGFLPSKLMGYQKATDRGFTLSADEESMKQPPMLAFVADKDRLGVLAARFRQYIRVELPPKSRARKVLTFLPELKVGEKALGGDEGALPIGDPAVVDSTFHRGRVVLIPTTVNREWNSWPGSPSYLPLMQEIFLHAIGGRLHGNAALVGDVLEQYLPVGNAKLEVALQTPDGRAGRTTVLDTEEGPLFRWSETDQSGLYRATVGALPREYLFAVNVPTASEGQEGSESDLGRIDKGGLQLAYSAWDFQMVADLKDVVHATAAMTATTTVTGPVRGMGAAIARVLLIVFFALVLVELILAWKLGRASKVAGITAPAPERWLPSLVTGLSVLVLIAGAGVLLHNTITDDFLGFLPDSVRGFGEALLGVPAPAAGESNHWRLESSRFLPASSANEPWILAVIALASVGLVVAVYLRENATAQRGERLALAALRVVLVLLTLGVLLPQLQLWFERQGWPDVALIVDDSESMATVDTYQDPKVKEAAAKLSEASGLGEPQRLKLAQALLTRPDGDWLSDLIARRKVKLHVYHLDKSTNAATRLADVTEPGHDDVARKHVLDLQPETKTSKLGDAIHQVISDFRGSSLSAVVMLTDGVTTDGEEISQASRFAAQTGVPLFFVGIGDDHEARELYLHDLQVEDTVFVNDRLVFEGRLTVKGYSNPGEIKVTLHKGTKDGPELEKPVMVTPGPSGKPAKFRITHQPTEAGEKTYVLVAKLPDGQAEPKENPPLVRTILVREAKPARVLYVEGYPRYDYRFVKMLLEREAANAQGNKTIDLKVLLLDADDDFAVQDRSARTEFPTQEELRQFDVIILGDVNPKDKKLGEKNIDLIVDFVRERGGGLLYIAGEHYGPQAFKDTKLADILPVVTTAPLPGPDVRAQVRTEAFKPQLTPVGRQHPIFRFSPDEVENQAIWDRLNGMFWYAEGYRLQPAAEVLAVHPKKRAVAENGAIGVTEDLHPLVVQHFVGNGRCLFLGFDETWRWRFREDELRFNQFWIQVIKYLARTGLGRVDLRLNRQTPYRRGEMVQITARFPDDVSPPPPDVPVKVAIEREGPGGETETQSLQLTKLEGSRATFEGFLNRTPEGKYKFSLSSPTVAGPKPHAEATILKPPGESDRLRMNQEEMERAAEETHGKFYTLADADHLPADLPTGSRVTLSTPGPPWLLWNHPLLFVFLLLVLATEWILRKRKHLV